MGEETTDSVCIPTNLSLCVYCKGVSEVFQTVTSARRASVSASDLLHEQVETLMEENRQLELSMREILETIKESRVQGWNGRDVEIRVPLLEKLVTVCLVPSAFLAMVVYTYFSCENFNEVLKYSLAIPNGSVPSL